MDVYSDPQPYPQAQGWTRVEYDLAPNHNIKSSDTLMGSIFLKFQMEQSGGQSGISVLETTTPGKLQLVLSLGTQDYPFAYTSIDFTKGPDQTRHQIYTDVLYNPVTQRTEAGTVSVTAAFDAVKTTSKGGVWLRIDYQSGPHQTAKLTCILMLAYQSAIASPKVGWVDYPGEAVTEVQPGCNWTGEATYSPIVAPDPEDCSECSATSSEWILEDSV